MLVQTDFFHLLSDEQWAEGVLSAIQFVDLAHLGKPGHRIVASENGGVGPVDEDLRLAAGQTVHCSLDDPPDFVGQIGGNGGQGLVQMANDHRPPIKIDPSVTKRVRAMSQPGLDLGDFLRRHLKG